jgi:POT family proton-dependent oligopeptide transporter
MGAFAWMNKRALNHHAKRSVEWLLQPGVHCILIFQLSSVAGFARGSVADEFRYLVLARDSYLILTVAELFLSPMGLSFVSKVAPSRFQGLMQGGWLLATAVGNKLLFIGTLLWDKVSLSTLWLVFIVCCLISATFIFSILKRLEKAASS